MEKINNKEMRRVLALLSVLLILSCFSIVSAAESNYCCEKTTSGAWCQNAPESSCDASYLKSPTSCDSTSYCKRGCCYDSQEGLCLESTPQRVCEDSEGTWADDEQCNIPQCTLGCCILADQGAFVTMARCKTVSGFYGLETDFRTTIANEVACIATAQGADKGACVKEDVTYGVKTCTFATRTECDVASQSTVMNSSELNITGNETAPVGFYADVLCSSEELGSICGTSTDTTILEGKDEIYYLDSCGNLANIYDANRYNDDAYWKNVIPKDESCGYGSSNANSQTCGNCDYSLGSIGRESTSATAQPTYGDYICIDLNCEDAGKRHGESWCAKDSPTGAGDDTVGSRYYKELCLFGEILTEPCADFRQEICIEDTFNGFSEAQCRTNRWQDCTSQQEYDDCTNIDVRECFWMDDYYFSSATGQIERSTNDSNADGNTNDPTPEGLCVPSYPPGLTFWSDNGDSATQSASGSSPFSQTNSSTLGTGYVNPATSGTTTSATDICNLGNVKVTFKWVKTERPADWFGLFDDEEWTCNNTECTRYIPRSRWKYGNITTSEAEAWSEDINKFCYRFGDCGGYINWLGTYTDDGYAAYLLNRRIAGSGGAEIIESTTTATNTTTTGSMIRDLLRQAA